MKDKVFHALVNPRIPLSDRQETLNPAQQAERLTNTLPSLPNNVMESQNLHLGKQHTVNVCSGSLSI